jgi:hypothetical protein
MGEGMLSALLKRCGVLCSWLQHHLTDGFTACGKTPKLYVQG